MLLSASGESPAQTLPTLMITTTESSVNETDGTVAINWQGTWSGPRAGDVSVIVRIGVPSDSATYGTDYSSPVNFGLGVFSVTYSQASTFDSGSFMLELTDDTEAEGNEVFTLTADAEIYPVVPAMVTIVDDDRLTPTGIMLSVDPTHVTEGSDTNPTPVTVTAAFLPIGATRTASTTVMVSVDSGTATEGTDFTPISTAIPVTIQGDITRGTGSFNLTVADDTLDELDETVTVTAPSAGGFAVTSATLTIADNDALGVTLSATTLAVMEGGEGSYTVVLDSAPAVSATVTIAAGTSTPTAPITVSPASLTFSSTDWHMHQTVTVMATEDTDALDGTRTLTHTVSGYGTVTRAASIVVAVADDDTPTITLGAETVNEGVASSMVTITAVLDLPVATGFTVTVSTADGTAEAASDYTAPTTILTFDGTESETETFTVPITNDNIAEGDETFTVSLGTPSGTTTTINTASIATVTITDNDYAEVSFREGAPFVGENDGTVRMTLILDEAVQGGFEVTVSTANGSATAGSDYAAIPTTLTFVGTPNEMKMFTAVSIIDDEVVEGVEDFAVVLSGASTTALVDFDEEAYISIDDNDYAAVTFSASSVTVGEDAGTATVTATLDNAVQGGFEVAVSTSPGTATSPSDYDYTVAGTTTNTTLTFAGMAGEIQEFTVSIIDDSTAEGAEMFTVSLSDAAIALSRITARDTITITITDDDEAMVTLGPETVAENAGSVTVTATLNNAVQDGFEVTVVTMDGTAEAGSDYTAPSTTLTFNGTVSEAVAFPVSITNNDIFDGDKEFTVGLSTLAETTATVAITGTATITIENDDPDPTVITLSLSPTRGAEEGDTTAVTVTAAYSVGVMLTADTTVTVTVGDSQDLAIAGTDYTPVEVLTVTILAGANSGMASFNLEVLEDTIHERTRVVDGVLSAGDEVLTVSGTADGFAVTSATLRLRDNDDTDEVVLSLSQTEVEEGASATITVTAAFLPTDVSLVFDLPVSVRVGNSGDSATEGTDYTMVEDLTITIAAGETSGTGTFQFAPTADAIDDSGETVTVSGSGLDYPITDLTLAITDPDPTVITLSLNPTRVDEGDTMAVTVTAAYSVGVTLTSATEVTVTVGDSGDLATAGTDYTPVEVLTVTISAGANSGMASFNLEVLEDTIHEETRVVDGVLSSENEALTVSGTADGFSVTSATLRLRDNDSTQAIVLSLSQTEVEEGASATVTVTAAILPTGVSLLFDLPLTVRVGNNGDSATEGTDYTMVDDFTITIVAGATSGTGTFQFAPTADAVDDPGETVTVSGSGIDMAIEDLTLEITDPDPPAITLSLNPTRVDEGATMAVTVTAAYSVGVTLTSATEVTVTVGDSGDLATEGTDYTPVEVLTVTILAGANSGMASFNLEVLEDTIHEQTRVVDGNLSTGDEVLTVSGTADGFSVTSATLTITDYDFTQGMVLSFSQTEVEEGASATVTVTAAILPTGISFVFDLPVLVTVGDNGDSATEGTDYTMVEDFTFTIAAGETSGTGTFQFAPTADAVDDPGETVTVSAMALEYTITDVALAITDLVPPAITLSLNPTHVDEGATTTVTATATLSGSVSLTSATEVTVTVGDSGDLATAGTDYTPVEVLTVTILAGANSGMASFDLEVLEDTIHEEVRVVDGVPSAGDEVLTVSGTADGFAVTSATLTITDNDDLQEIVLSISQTEVEEGASATVTVTAAIVPTGVSLVFDLPVLVTVGDNGDSATEGTDYTMVEDLTITIAAGATSGTGTFQFAPTADAVDDPGEAVTVSGLAFELPVAAALTLAITDTDPTPTAITLSLNPTHVDEGSTTTVTATATLAGTVSLTSATEVTVTVGDSEDLATAGTDYTPVEVLTVTILAGALSGTANFNLEVLEDTIHEETRVLDGDLSPENEALTVSGTADGFAVTSATLAIRDNDDAEGLVLSISQTEAEEGASPTVTVTVALVPTGVTLLFDFPVPVAVGNNGDSATEGTDYTMVDDLTITIPVGATSGTSTFQFAPTADAIDDPGETVTVFSLSPEVQVAALTLAITDTDTAPTAITLSVTPVSVAEGATTTVTATAMLSGTVSLTSATEVTVSVAGGTASTADFTAVGDVTVTIPAGALSGTANFNLAVTEDTVVDPDETLTVSGTAVPFTITPATLTVDDNDTAPAAIALSLNPTSVSEDSGTTSVTVTASFSGSSSILATETEVTVSVAADTASTADFTAVGNVTVTIPAEMTSGTASFDLVVTNDVLAEGDETLSVSGTAAASYGTIPPATLTITDDDTASSTIALSLTPTSAAEGATPTVTVTATLAGTVSRTSATNVTVSVAAGTASTADFTAVLPFTVTIPANMLSGTASFNLTVTEDPVVDPDETLTVSGTATSFTITSTTLTITDNDTAPTSIALSLNQTSVIEGATTTVAVTAEFPGSVTLTTATEVTVSVAGGTAEAADFTTIPAAITVTIPAGATSGTAKFILAVTDDTLVEGDETVTVSGTAAASYGTIPSVTLTIIDDDTAPTSIALSLNPTSVMEGAATTVVVTAEFPGNATLTTATEVTVSVAGGTAEAADFTATPAAITVTIPAGATRGTANCSLAVTDDTLVEGDETVTVSGTAAASFGTIPSVTLTITDDDTAPTTIALSLNPTRAAEGATTTVTVTAAYPGNATLTTATEVTVSVAAGTAQATDFTAVSDFMVTIAVGMTSGMNTFDLVATEDTDLDPNETVTVSGTATGFTTVTSATLTIDDNETPPAAITLAAATVGAGAGSVTVTATLDNAVEGGLTVTVATTDGTATAGEDYTTPTTILTFVGTASEIQTFPVAITDDNRVEGDETFTVSMTKSAIFPDTIDISSTATVTITDDEVNPTEVILSLTPYWVEEDSGTTTIAVTAAYPGGATLTTATEVTVSVAGGTASAADFIAVSDFTLTIDALSSSGRGSFDLTVTEDEETEGSETLTVSGAATGFAVISATLTILEVNSTTVVQEVVPELTRLSVASVIDAVADRVGRVAAGTANTLISFAGHQSLAPALAANEQRLNEGDLSWREVLENLSFDLNLEGTDEEVGSGGGQAEPGGTVGIWASGGYENVSRPDVQLGAWEGDLFSVHAGVDIRVSENVLVGVAANWFEGSFEFEGNELLKTDSQLTTINPYLGWNSGDGAGLWATIGYGKGKVEMALDEPERDLTMGMVALGGSIDISGGDGVSLAVKGEGSAAQLKTAAVGTLEAVMASIQRLRLALEVQGVTVQDSGEQFTQSVALGIRHDGGDGDTGLGAELDGELGWSASATGVTLKAIGHVLLAHQSDLKEWGVGGLIRYASGSSEGRGLSLRLQPSYGAESGNGQLWEHQVTELESESDDAPEARLAMRLDWGLPALSGRGLLTPYGNFELSEDGERIYRLGSRFELGPSIHIDLGGDRKEAADEAPEYGIDLAVRVYW